MNWPSVQERGSYSTQTEKQTRRRKRWTAGDFPMAIMPTNLLSLQQLRKGPYAKHVESQRRIRLLLVTKRNGLHRGATNGGTLLKEWSRRMQCTWTFGVQFCPWQRNWPKREHKWKTDDDERTVVIPREVKDPAQNHERTATAAKTGHPTYMVADRYDWKRQEKFITQEGA